ncbi:hypothetical protein ACN4EE_06225 [Geminocystis sp. CENA526]|uniref:hypothetical protein n=1 Tax=Geminocystis sp. CENA526 TaxID=1355871 RepID=UPI003D6F96A2
MKHKSLATMSIKDLESLIDKIVEGKLNNLNLKEQDNLDKTDIVRQIDNLRERIEKKYGKFPDSTYLIQEDRIR